MCTRTNGLLLKRYHYYYSQLFGMVASIVHVHCISTTTYVIGVVALIRGHSLPNFDSLSFPSVSLLCLTVMVIID